ncbi:MAG: hypothetical protein VX252_06620, partial [Myxococcota bacterium]|nr:hypothetical protein [Myxococcota bacterium]
ADLFSRVEALPYEPTLKILQEEKTWDDPKGWIEHLESKALGPNIASFIGHSDIRARVMGLDRATNGSRPSESEKNQMIGMLKEAIEAGFLGLSTMTNPWDKLDGDRYRSRALPSTYATWKEYRWFNRVLREEGRVLQSAPNLNTKINILGFFLESAGLFFRKALKTSLISAADPKASPWVPLVFGPITRIVNNLLGANFRWQGLPCPFEVYADGIDLVVFEEFDAGADAMHIADEFERNELMKDQAYRRRFRKDYEKKFAPRIWQRDFYDATIVACPDEGFVGMSIGAVADQKNIHPCDAFLDLVAEYGKRFRWKTVIANHRPQVLRDMQSQPTVQVGFSDSGAHLRNMAFYNFPLHLLRMAKNNPSPGDFIPVERAVQKLSSELADWYGIDAGKLEIGARADIALINPEGLDEELDTYAEAPMPAMDVQRMVKRNDRAVVATIIGGKLAFAEGQFTETYGHESFGRFLRAGEDNRLPTEPERKEDPLAATA